MIKGNKLKRLLVLAGLTVFCFGAFNLSFNDRFNRWTALSYPENKAVLGQISEGQTNSTSEALNRNYFQLGNDSGPWFGFIKIIAWLSLIILTGYLLYKIQLKKKLDQYKKSQIYQTKTNRKKSRKNSKLFSKFWLKLKTEMPNKSTKKIDTKITKIVFGLFSIGLSAFLITGYFSLAGGTEENASGTFSGILSLFVIIALFGGIGILGYFLWMRSERRRYKEEHREDFIYRN